MHAKESGAMVVCSFYLKFFLECHTSILSYSVLLIWCKTIFTFPCSKDVLRITDGTAKGQRYCGNKTGQNVSVTGGEVEIMFHSDGEIERRGYLLNFTLVSLPTASSGKWEHKEAGKTLFSHIWNESLRFCG